MRRTCFLCLRADLAVWLRADRHDHDPSREVHRVSDEQEEDRLHKADGGRPE